MGVTIQSLYIGGDRLVVLPPRYREDLSSMVSSGMRRHTITARAGTEIRVDLELSRIVCRIGRRSFEIATTEAQKLARNIRGFARVTSNDPGQLLAVSSSSQKVYDELYPATSSGIPEKVDIFFDVASNTSQAFSSIKDAVRLANQQPRSHSTWMRSMGGLNDLFWIIIGLFDTKSGGAEYESALRVNDHEGVVRAHAKKLSSLLILIGALIDGLTRLIDGCSVEIGEVASKVFEIISSVTLGISSAIGLVFSAVGIRRCVRFKDRVYDLFLENKTLTPDQQAKGAYLYLRDQIVVTLEEREEIHARIKDPNKANAEIESLTQKKIREFKRRSSLKAVNLILQANPQNTQEMKEIIRQVMVESNKKIIFYQVLIFACLINLTALVLSTSIGFNVVCKSLYAASSTIYALIGVLGLYTSLVRRDGDSPLAAFQGMLYMRM